MFQPIENFLETREVEVSKHAQEDNSNEDCIKEKEYFISVITLSFFQ